MQGLGGVDDNAVDPQEEEEKLITAEDFLMDLEDIDNPGNFKSPAEPVQAKDPDREEEAQAPNQLQTPPLINNPISPHSLIGMPNLNKTKPMRALTYQPTPTPVETVVIPEQVATFLNQQPVNHPWQPNSSVFNEPFIQHYEKTFKQKPILMLTYDQKPETQVEGLQNVNTNQHIDIRQQVAEYALMEANHTEPIIIEVPRVLGNAQAPIQTIVIPPQVANFVNQQPINNLLQILNPFNELFIPQAPVDFSQTYQPEG
jgi:hypothetical protein